MSDASVEATSMGPGDDPGSRAVRTALASWGIESAEFVEMPGGASTRRFFRVPHRNATAIAMYIPEPSQEIAKARQARGGGPFVEVARLLEGSGVRVPQILERCDENQVLLVEDLGDDTLANYLLKHPAAKTAVYQSAVVDLAHAQAALAELPAGSVVQTRAFDEDLLRWEVDHFRHWALRARGIELSSEDAQTFDECAHYLASTIAGWKRGFVHRDYQSRNLMVRATESGPHLVWIDFQDAMMGPRAYDLVALLTDSYQTFTPGFIEARLDDFCRARGIPDEGGRLRFEFDFITVQRKLKDAGRFIFIERVNGNAAFLKYVEPTIDKARLALERVKSEGPLEKLQELLDRVL